jgi:UPF0271 protein
MYQIDLNCDMGESFGAYIIGMDEKVIPYISSANIACGYHASDPVVMEKTISLAKEQGVAIGAHPGFPDMMGFGRRNMNVTPAEAKAYVQYQLGALDALCRAQGMTLQHVKPHGALYNMAGKDYSLAYAICEGVKEVNQDLIMLVLSGSQMQKAAQDLSLKVAKEVFADRAYEEDGSLVDRKKEGAMILDEEIAIARIIRIIKEKKVEAISGKIISMEADSVCVHGDGEKAHLFVQKLQSAFLKEDIQIRNLRR